MTHLRLCMTAALVGSLVWLTPVQALAGSAKILLYHHISESTPASTSVKPEVFDDHLNLIESSGYQVVPLARIVDALMNGVEMDSRWVAITFDDAYESIYSEAAPRLKARGWPYTIFVSTDFIDSGNTLYLSWDQLRSLEREGATAANHTQSHEHMIRRQSGENMEAWSDRLTDEIMGAQSRLTAELEDPLRLFAYPYGEFNAEIAGLMRALGFIAFGQQSGPVGRTSSPYAIPRFPLGTGFDSVDSLAEKLRTEHLPLLNPPVPADVLTANAEAPRLTLTIDESDGTKVRPGSMTCFVAGQPKTEVSWRGTDTFTVQAEKAFSSGRSKYTCTAPHPSIRRAYYWHTHLFMKPLSDGTWYEG